MRRDHKGSSVRTLLLAAAVAAVLSYPLAVASGSFKGAGSQSLDEAQARLAKKVRHELVMLPWLSVFDNIQFSLEGNDTVILSGEVVRPTLKSGAENVSRRVEGITKVINNIEVLPVSPFDDRIRLAEYRAIFSQPGLDRYALQPLSPIRIVVKNGNVTLVGVVASTMDKNLAGIAANRVANVFSVKNDLIVEGRS